MQLPPWTMYIYTAVVVLVTIAMHSLNSIHDPHKCSALSHSGSWLDPAVSERSKTPFSKWQPDFCMAKTYKAKQAASCLASTKDAGAVFVGDSTVRELFWALARKIDSAAAKTQSAQTDKHVDITFQGGSSSLKFYWDPFLNSSRIAERLSPSRFDSSEPASSAGSQLLVFGAGLWFARHSRRPVEDYKEAVDAVTKNIPEPLLGSFGKHRPVLVPVLPPFYDNLDHDHKTTIHPEDVNAMNAYLPEVGQVHDVDVMTSYVHMVEQLPASAYDSRALHAAPHVWDQQADLLLNLKCNNLATTYPYDGTCCYDYPFSLVPAVSILIGAVLSMLFAWTELKKWAGMSPDKGILGTLQEKRTNIIPIITMWAALVYCWLADRTQVFDKISKLYNIQDFVIFTLAIFIVGGATIKASATPQRPGQEKRAAVDQPFLSRDQTDEWKGWMQLFILAYHYTGGSKILAVYKFIRLLVASYLFMTGYGHAAYFYQKNDFSLKRVVAVNFRINLLSMLLPWMMDADYLFYYFAPLVTYWYAIIYLTMRFKSEWNQNLGFLMGKIAAACACTSLLHTQPWLLDPLFQLINAVFGSKWDATEWLFRCKLDQLIVYLGMIVSILYIRSKKPPAPPAPPQGSMATTSHTQPGKSPHLRNSLYFVLSGAALVVYLYLASTRTTKTSSNALHTYISPLPILAFIHLRNSTRTLRNHYSGAFAWIGKISLETFVLQYHIWLASDTKGLLITGLFGSGQMPDGSGLLGAGMGLARWADCILLGVVFIWVSSKVASATGGITAAATKAMF